MKEKILNALKEAGVETDGLTDDQLFEKHNELLTNKATEAAEAAAKANADEGDGSDIGKAVTAALKPLTDKVDALATKINAADEAEVLKMAEIVGNSDKHPGIDVDEAKALPLGTLRKMAANCADAHGLNLNVNLDGEDKAFAAPAEMSK